LQRTQRYIEALLQDGKLTNQDSFVKTWPSFRWLCSTWQLHWN